MNYKQVLCTVILLGICSAGNIEASDQPQRIISLGSYVTEALFLLQVEDRLIGVTTYCNRPIEAKKKEKAGSIVDVNIEKVISLKPDMIIATPLTNAKAKDKLKELGMRIEELEQVDSFEAICKQFLKIGRLVGREQLAKELVDKAKKEVNDAHNYISGLPLKKVFVQVGTKPLFTMNKEFFINDLIKRAGGINIAEDSSSGIYSREKVVEANPDVILIASMGVAAEDEIKTWEHLRSINAVKNGKIYVMDPDIICNPIPENFSKTLKKIVSFLHKEAKHAE